MNVPLKLAGFGAVLVVVFAASFGVGRAVGPVGETDDDHHARTDTEQTVPTSDPHHAPEEHG